jgi:hypothetical protein
MWQGMFSCDAREERSEKMAASDGLDTALECDSGERLLDFLGQ